MALKDWVTTVTFGSGGASDCADIGMANEAPWRAAIPGVSDERAAGVFYAIACLIRAAGVGDVCVDRYGYAIVFYKTRAEGCYLEFLDREVEPHRVHRFELPPEAVGWSAKRAVEWAFKERIEPLAGLDVAPEWLRVQVERFRRNESSAVLRIDRFGAVVRRFQSGSHGPRYYVWVRDATSGLWHELELPPEADGWSPKRAVAWTFDLAEHEYNPTEEA